MADRSRWAIGVVTFAGLLCGARAADAQGGVIGIGPRLTFQRADDGVPDTSSLRFVGGQLKLRLSPKTAIELAADYKSSTSETLAETVKSLPFQASLMLYPIRAAISPYVLGGIGWYSTTSTPLGPTTSGSTTTRDVGYHMGVGAELALGRRVALHFDYRYTHVRFGENDPGAPSTPGGLPLPGTGSLQNALRLSHQGSMTNIGFTFFF